MTHYCVGYIEYVSDTPNFCIRCQRNEFGHDVVIAMTGKNPSQKKTVLCLACETLMIITTEEKNYLSLTSSIGNTVIIKSANKPK